jgi:ATP-binding cassette subfamily E protein 1
MDIEELCTKDRIAIVDPNKCKPNKCGKECIKICPTNRQGKICIDLDNNYIESIGAKRRKIATIAESLCIGCGMCANACPFNAIKIVNVPKGLKKDIVHRYGKNSFKLHKLPNIKSGQITGILGQNGLGKSTVLNIFQQNITMNLGKFDIGQEIIDKATFKRFRGMDIQKIINNKIKTQLKPQNINKIRQDVLVRDYLNIDSATNFQGIDNLLNRSLLNISGGELQRVIIHKVCSEDADLYMFDEPTSFLDLKQRIEMANNIRSLIDGSKKYVMVVDHDINILDYISDQVVILYGERAVYGICATPLPINYGINSYFDGYLQKDNVRFRKTPFKFETSEQMEIDESKSEPIFSYDEITYKVGDFNLQIEAAKFTDNGITVLLGENGAGKTTFVKLISEMSEGTDSNSDLVVSVKDQYIDQIVKSNGKLKVKDFLGDRIYHSPFMEIVRKLDITSLISNKLKSLSGGELQKVMIVKCMMKNANIYLFDEPSAFLDTETRIIVSKIIKNYFFDKNSLIFLIDHDMLMTTYLADYAILFEGEPGLNMFAKSPVPIKDGMNQYLKNLSITMRIDQSSRRRLNKLNSAKDQEQKKTGIYY